MLVLNSNSVISEIYTSERDSQNVESVSETQDSLVENNLGVSDFFQSNTDSKISYKLRKRFLTRSVLFVRHTVSITFVLNLGSLGKNIIF